MNSAEFDLYVQQFKELDELLHCEWLELKALLESEGINLTDAHLISILDSEDNSQWGVILTHDKTFITFDRDIHDNIKFKYVNNDDDLQKLTLYEPAIEAAFLFFK